MNRKTLAKKAMATFFLSLLCLLSFAQGHLVSGIVTDADGEPMIGVNVVVKGTTNGTITDIEGRFKLSGVSEKSVLMFSYIGYVTQNIAIGNQTSLKVTMADDSKSLEEVVVVGYGVVKKSDLTGSVGTVTAEKIASIGTSSIMGALQGATPGVDITMNSTRPGSGYDIQIRGQNSIEGGNPLYVVDGIVTSGIDFLNPADIERIDVLKDASSTAIYGSRGSNGVVIVQTKGAASVKSKMTVSYDGYYGVRKIARVPDFMDGREWTDFRTSTYYTWDATNLAYTLTASNQKAVTQNSKLVNQALYDQQYTDWLGLGTKDGSQQNHYINIAGSGGNISYNLGVGYQDEEGNFLLEEMNRYTLKGSIEHKASKFFTTGANFALTHQIINTGSQYGYRDLMRMPVVLKAYDDDGNLIDQPGIKANIEGDGNFTSSANPLIEIQSGSNETRRFDVLGSIYMQFTPLEGVNFKTTFSPSFNRTRNGYYYEANANRTYNQAQNKNQETFDWTWDNVLTLNKKFKEVHNLNLTLINSVYKSQYEYLTVYAENFPYDSQWYNMFNGTVSTGNSGSGYTQVTMLSYAARANYDYAGKYLVTGTVRYDGSSKLADKWAAFPSAAVAWRMSEEEFLKDVKWLDNLKLRVSWGYSGNNNGVSAYGTQVSPKTSSNVLYDFGGTVVSGFGTGTPVNTSLTWEKTREWDFGLDFGIFGGRINGGIDYYDKISDGLLMDRTLTIESGVSSMTDNIGSVHNKGWEISLNTQNIKTRDWQWNTSFTFAKNKNAIRSLYGKREDVISESRFIGQPINLIYDYKVNGLYSKAEWDAMTTEQRTNMGATAPGYSKAVDMTGEGKMSTDDKTILGHCDPDWTGSLSSTLMWKNFDFSFNIYTRQGQFVNDYFLQEFGVAANSQRGRPKVNQDYYIPGDVSRIDYSNFTLDTDGQPWVSWGTSTEHVGKVPIYNFRGNYYGGNGSYQDASFVKVRNITFGYTFNKELIKKVGLSYARFYLNVLNPFTFTNYVGWDPEYATTTLQNGNGPSTVTYQFGVNLKF
ncbi:MAG: TonB-linked outer membrane protein, SusC/RagA family [Bacteroidetes bacterium]|nr:TonB-linked outer membrane protein, SusC/RagA family [Bacteroidota bacterium]